MCQGFAFLPTLWVLRFPLASKLPPGNKQANHEKDHYFSSLRNHSPVIQGLKTVVSCIQSCFPGKKVTIFFITYGQKWRYIVHFKAMRNCFLVTFPKLFIIYLKAEWYRDLLATGAPPKYLTARPEPETGAWNSGFPNVVASFDHS